MRADRPRKFRIGIFGLATNIDMWHKASMENLRTYRKAHGITQCDLAEQLGITQGTVSKIESGKRKPDIDLVYRIEQLTKGAVSLKSWVAAE